MKHMKKENALRASIAEDKPALEVAKENTMCMQRKKAKVYDDDHLP